MIDDRTHRTKGSIFLDEAIFEREEGVLLHTKAMMVLEMRKQIQEEGLTTPQALEAFGITEEVLALINGGDFETLTIDALLAMLLHANREATLTIAPLKKAA